MSEPEDLQKKTSIFRDRAIMNHDFKVQNLSNTFVHR